MEYPSVMVTGMMGLAVLAAVILVGSVYRFFCFKPQCEEKENRDGIWHILAPSILGLGICVLCLCGTSWAWFTAVQSSSVEVVESAAYSLTVTVAEQTDAQTFSEESAEGQALTPGEDGRICAELEANHSYRVTLQAAGTASSGYGRITCESTDGGSTVYQTAPIEKDDTYTFTIHTAEALTLKIEALWGSPADDGTENILENEGVIGTAPVASEEEENIGTDGDDENQSKEQEQAGGNGNSSDDPLNPDGNGGDVGSGGGGESDQNGSNQEGQESGGEGADAPADSEADSESSTGADLPAEQ